MSSEIWQFRLKKPPTRNLANWQQAPTSIVAGESVLGGLVAAVIGVERFV